MSWADRIFNIAATILIYSIKQLCYLVTFCGTFALLLRKFFSQTELKQNYHHN